MVVMWVVIVMLMVMITTVVVTMPYDYQLCSAHVTMMQLLTMIVTKKHHLVIIKSRRNDGFAWCNFSAVPF